MFDAGPRNAVARSLDLNPATRFVATTHEYDLDALLDALPGLL